jgi:hypothetical protein
MKSLHSAILFLIFGLMFLTSPVQSSHYIGGEIRWECMPNGNYRFIMKLYRECGSYFLYNNQEFIVTNAPCGTIAMNAYPDLQTFKTDISPVCNANPAYSHITCQSTYGTSYAGGQEQWYYTSDLAFPDGVVLNGVPPVTGWYFGWSKCCRNPCSNIPLASSTEMVLKAVMYPYNNLNATPCYNDAPIFAEPPQVIIPTNSPASYNPTAIDINGDLLTYEFTSPLQTFQLPVTTWANGYSATQPFPGLYHNPLNQPVTFDLLSGQMNFLSKTQGAFIADYKVTEFRNGIRLSEIRRGFQLVIVNSDFNPAPAILPPFPSNPDPWTDSVFYGELVTFPIYAVDSGLQNNNIDFQWVSLDVNGMMMGMRDTARTKGCPCPPCATLTQPSPVVDIAGASTRFTWQTTHDHLLMGNNSAPNKSFYFIIKAIDDYCPFPNYAMQTVKIVVRDSVFPRPLDDRELTGKNQIQANIHFSQQTASFELSCQESTPVNIQITNLAGQLIFYKSFQADEGNTLLTRVPRKGLYLYTILSKGSFINGKIIVP